MPSKGWQFDATMRRYRNPNGRLLTIAQMIALRNAFADSREQRAQDIALLLLAGALTTDAFNEGFEAFIADTILVGYLLGRGGINQATAGDYTRITELIDRQAPFWDGFRATVADEFRTDERAGLISDTQLVNRAGLYAGAAVNAYEEGQGAAYGVSLPGYPADGKVICGNRCRCHWKLVEFKDRTAWRAKWIIVGDGGECKVCKRRSREWSDLVLQKDPNDPSLPGNARGPYGSGDPDVTRQSA